MDWIYSTVGEFCPFIYGKGLPQSKRKAGNVPVYGSNGCVDHHDDSYVKPHGIIIGRKGSVGAVHLCDEPFWPIDTSFYVEKESIDELRFTYYLLKSLGLEHMNSDSAVPGLNRENAHSLTIKIPEQVEDREALGAWIAKFDQKISLNRQINQTLEAMAQAIFKSWFVDFEPVKAKIAAIEAGEDAEDVICAAMRAISGKTDDELNQLQAGQPEHYAQLKTTAGLFPVAMQDSELGEVPEGWEVSTIGEEVDVVGGGTPSTKNPEF
jgi:type I restriction enzyme S subunit